jgi:hypothetical protein
MPDFTGRVAQFQASTQESGYGEGKQTLQVWDFEVQHLNDAGDIQEVVSVQMVARAFSGRIRNDEDVTVTVPADDLKRGTVQVDRIYSNTRRLWITAAKPGPMSRVLGGIVVVFILGFIVVIFAIIIPHLPIGDATVPNVAGFSSVHAAQVLGDAGFSTTAEDEHHPNVKFGSVIRTDPPAGTKAAKGSRVTMVISDGP